MGIFSNPFKGGTPLSALGDLLGGGSGDKPNDFKARLGARANISRLADQLDPANRAAVLSTLDTSSIIPPSQRLAYYQQTLSGLPSMVAQSRASQAQLQQQQQQTQLGAQYLQDHLQSLISSGDAQAQFIRNLLPSVPEQFRGILEYDAQNRADYGRRLAASMLQQYQAQPLIDAYQRQLAMSGQSLNSAGSAGKSQQSPTQSLYGSLGG